MSTPTPGKLVPAQVAATPPASTPFSSSNHLPYLALSPQGLRSVVPSPQLLKKSPANSQMIFNQGASSSFGAGYGSPNAAMALGGVSGLSDLGLDTLSGVTSLRRDDEEERAKKIELVSDILRQKTGRVSESGVERLAKMVGFECLWESQIDSEISTRTLIIAGSTLALDIDLEGNIVKNVSLTFPDNPECAMRHIEKTNTILLRDLKLQKNESPLTKTLDRFSKNLKYLATLDKLSILPKVNCHEAIAGIYESLDMIYKWETERLREAGEELNIVKSVICEKSGRPTMHARDRLGLSVDYWQNMWRIDTKAEGLIWSILIECDSMAPLSYTPIRVSKNWISTEIEKKNSLTDELIMTPDNEPLLDWLEPENTVTLITESDNLTELGQSETQNLPEITFVAKFDPPLTVPGSIAAQIYDSVQTTLDPYQTTTYDGLIFPPKDTEKNSLDSGSIFREIEVPVYSKTGERTTCFQRVRLYFEKIDYGRTLSVIPFSHPKQLIQMLPILRQYALMSRLLLNPFSSPVQSSIEQKPFQQRRKQENFELFMSTNPDYDKIPLKVDIVVYTQPFPQIRVLFPFKKRVADLLFEVKLNGIVEVITQNILPDEGYKLQSGRIITVADLARILEMTENLPIWVEFIRRKLE